MKYVDIVSSTVGIEKTLMTNCEEVSKVAVTQKRPQINFSFTEAMKIGIKW